MLFSQNFYDDFQTIDTTPYITEHLKKFGITSKTRHFNLLVSTISDVILNTILDYTYTARYAPINISPANRHRLNNLHTTYIRKHTKSCISLNKSLMIISFDVFDTILLVYLNSFLLSNKINNENYIKHVIIKTLIHDGVFPHHLDFMCIIDKIYDIFKTCTTEHIFSDISVVSIDSYSIKYLATYSDYLMKYPYVTSIQYFYYIAVKSYFTYSISLHKSHINILTTPDKSLDLKILHTLFKFEIYPHLKSFYSFRRWIRQLYNYKGYSRLEFYNKVKVMLDSNNLDMLFFNLNNLKSDKNSIVTYVYNLIKEIDS